MTHTKRIGNTGGSGSIRAVPQAVGSLEGRRVVVMGLGRFGGGVGAARFAAKQGASVVVTDTLDAEALTESVERLADTDVRFKLGGHDVDDFASADVVIANPAVPRDANDFLRAASGAGARITSEIELLIERLPDRAGTIGITGTAGKSTTTAMLGHILSQAMGRGCVHIGGNLGGSLLDRVSEIEAGHRVVLELSSFMLEGMAGWSPGIAVVTNISDNHLDRHGTMACYTQAKQRLLAWQRAGDVAILGEGVSDWPTETGVDRVIVLEGLGGELVLPGEHNRVNAAMAVEAAVAAGVDRSAAEEAARGFTGLPHRMALVAEVGGVRYYDDSKSTTPQAAMLALGSFEPGTVHLILGGYDKKSDFGELAAVAATRAAGVYTIGVTGPAIAERIDAVAGRAGRVGWSRRCGTLEVAVETAAGCASAGQSVVMSPGCASWDQFENYEHRGRIFLECVLRKGTRS